jgi:hypothetical protein
VKPWAGVAVVFLCVAAFYAVLVARRADQHSVRWFVHLGHEFLTTSTKSNVLTPALGWQSRVGYDGQYYFAVAVDPSNARHYIGGNSGIVYSRIFYPAAARVAGAGSVDAVPYAMLVINLLAITLGSAALALWLRRQGGPEWPAVVFGLFPGAVFTVIRDLTEPLAFGLVAAGILALDARRPRRVALSSAIFALALLTRETIFPFVVAAAAAVVFTGDGHRRWRRGVAFLAGSFGPLLVWRLIVTALLGQSTQEVGGSGWGVPFHGIFSYWPWDHQHRLIVLTIVLPSLALAAAAVPLLRRREGRIAGALLIANILLYVVFLPDGVDVDYGAAGRAAVGVVFAAALCVPYWRLQRPHRLRLALAAPLAFSVTILWYLLVAKHYGLDAMDLISS